MPASTTDLILHALTGIRGQIIAYHQMRAQAIVFNSGLGVAAAGFTLSRHNEPAWVLVALIGPNIFLIVALYLARYFRQLLDCCQAIETDLHDELRKALEITEASAPSGVTSESLGEATLKPNSAVFYREALQKVTRIDGSKIPRKLWHDAPQKALITYILAYLLFWMIWFKPWKLILNVFS